MARHTVFNGTKIEELDLLATLERNCTCVFDGPTQVRSSQCEGHRALIEDQRFVDGLLVYRHLRERLQGEETAARRERPREN